MFDQIFERSHAIQHQLAAPLLEARLAYLRQHAEQGASRSSLRKLAQYLLVVTERLNLHLDGEAVTGEMVERAADRWARRRPRHPHMKAAFSALSKARFLWVATNWLRFLDRLVKPKTQTLPFAQLVADFAKYMQEERGLSRATIQQHCWVVGDFLSRAPNAELSLRDIGITQIDETLARKGDRDGYGRRTIQSYASCLRVFFRYAEGHGLCRPGLADAIMAPRVFGEEILPASPSWNDVQRLLASTEGDHPTVIRDRAILMLLALYGLRSGEVRSLCLEDVDWEKDLLHLKRSKSRRTQILPLSRSVGASILRYLREVRPRAARREVFLTRRYPFRPLTSAAVFRIVQCHWQPLDHPIRHRGPHALRHACATRLINQGVTLKAIGDLLGHRGLETTRIYTKVDLRHLRHVADLDLGGLQ